MTARPRVGPAALFVVSIAAAALSACAPKLLTLPSGAGSPLTTDDANASLAQATTACRAARTLTAEVAVSGSASGRRLRGRLSAGVSSPASARLEAVAPFGPPLFIFVAKGNDATLLLPRDDRVLEHERPDLVLEAVAGVPLGASDLDATLKGCASASGAIDARQVGDQWRILRAVGGDELFLHRDNKGKPWLLVATVRGRDGTERRWRAEFRDHQNGLPRSIRVTSLGGDRPGRAFDLHLALSQVEVNPPLDADAFTVQIPRSATPITIDELKKSGPLAPPSTASDGR
jgi:hypothetical protein